MISYQEALDIIIGSARNLPTQTMPIAEALGLICAKDIFGNEAIPPFNNSAMDGFALCASDTQKATNENPLRMQVAGSTVAGDAAGAGQQNTAWEIMTGAPMPSVYDTVVMIEQVTITQRDAKNQATEILLTAPLAAGGNIRLSGEDFKPGDLLIRAGTLVSPENITALASLGITAISVFAPARIAILSTGKELIDKGELKPGQIRNSNGPYLHSALIALHTKPQLSRSMPDEPDQFEAYVTECSLTADIIISTGAVSAGSHDFIPQSLKNLGATILFHKVAIRPGKPILFAQLPNGVYYFGLPGNPVSAAVGLRFFVTPLLRAMQECSAETFPTAQLTSSSKKKNALRFFMKARVDIDKDGCCKVAVLEGQESFKIKPLLYANAWAIIPEDQTDLSAGSKIQFAPLHSDSLNLNPSIE